MGVVLNLINPKSAQEAGSSQADTTPTSIRMDLENQDVVVRVPVYQPR